MSGGTAQRDGSTLPPSVRFTASTDRLRAAIDNLDAAAKAEFIFPDSPLGAWVAAQKDVLNALYVMEEGREEQLRMLIEGAKAMAEAEAARAQAEVRRLGLFIDKAEIELAEKQSESVTTIGKAIAAHVQGALVIRAKAYNTAKYLTTALLYAVVLLGTLLGGYAWSTGTGGTTTSSAVAVQSAASTSPSGSATQAVAGTDAAQAASGSGSPVGTAAPSAPVGTGADTLVLNLSEGAYKGDARFQFSVDGKAVGPVQSVTALHGKGQPEAFTFKGDWSGAHRFGVTFTNDAWGGSAGVDRNLYVDSATFDGTAVEGAAALYGNGTVTFGTMPGQAAPSQTGAASQAGTVPAGTGPSGSATPAAVGTGADTLVLELTAANVHDTQPVAALLALAAQGGWTIERVKVDGIYVGPRMAQAAQDHGVDVQVTTRDADVKGFKPLPLRWRIEATFGTLSNRWHRLTRNLEQSPAAAEDGVAIANCHRLLRAYHRPEYIVA